MAKSSSTTKNPYKTMFKGTSVVKKKDGMHRPEGAGNFDNADDYNEVLSLDSRQGTIQHTPANDKDIANKKYVDDKNVESLPTSLSSGSVVFSDGTNLAQDNFNLFWDNATNELQPHLLKIVDDGTQAAPALKFNDTNTGFFKLGDSVRLSINNSTEMIVDATGITGNLIPNAELDAGAHTIGFTQQSITGDGTDVIDWRLGNKFFFTFPAGNETLTFTAPTNPCNLVLVIKQDSVGSRIMTFPTIKWAGGSAPTLSTAGNSIDIISLYYDGTSYYGVASLDFS